MDEAQDEQQWQVRDANDTVALRRKLFQVTINITFGGSVPRGMSASLTSSSFIFSPLLLQQTHTAKQDDWDDDKADDDFSRQLRQELQKQQS